MDLELSLEKSLEENASSYFEKSKLAKKKLAGLREAMAGMQGKIAKSEKAKEHKPAEKSKRHWFQAFHWFRASSGHLVIAGKDSKSNETIVKKHLDEKDIFLHADIQGAASTVIKEEGVPIPQETLEEAAQFAAVWSKAWQQRLASVDVYAVSKEQVSKRAPAGEAIGQGAFMIYGKRQWFRKTPLKFALGLIEGKNGFSAMSGPPSAIKNNCIAFFEIGFGAKKKSDLAKELLERLAKKTGKSQPVSIDEIIATLPGEGLEIA